MHFEPFSHIRLTVSGASQSVYSCVLSLSLTLTHPLWLAVMSSTLSAHLRYSALCQSVEDVVVVLLCAPTRRKKAVLTT